MNLKKAILLRSWIAFALVLLLALAVVWQIAELQFTQKDKYISISKNQSTKWREIQASRGNIYAEDGSLLATSIPKYELRMDTKVETVPDDTFYRYVMPLSTLMAQHFTERNALEWRNYLVSARKRGDRYLLLKRDVDYTTAKAMATWPIFNLGKYKGGFIKIEKFKRELPFGWLAMRTIGYSNDAGVKVGLEGSYDSLLTGTVGKRLEQRIYGGVWKPVEDGEETEPHNGLDVYTTIDINIQDVAESALQRCMINNNADRGCAILMEVETGAIKAIANLTKNQDNTYSESDNYAINDFSDPGSTFKLISAMALLEDKRIKVSDTIDINWGNYDQTLKMEDSHPHPMRFASFQYIFENSSNVGIGRTVQKHYKNNPNQFVKYAMNLGLDKPFLFDIKTRRSPLFKTPKSKTWSHLSLSHMSIGYEMEVSPLQMLSVYNAVANNGKLMRPYLVSEVKSFGQVVKHTTPLVLNPKVCSDSTLKQLRFLLESVVQNGTGKSLKGLDYTVAGKTGTAQIARPDGRGYDERMHKASFVGYFPADKPKYSCIVVINTPSANYYGGSLAGPVVKEIADKIYSTNLSLHKPLKTGKIPSLPEVKNGNRQDIKYVLNNIGISSHQIQGSAEGEWVKSEYNVQSLNLIEIPVDVQLVPDVKGMGLRDALYLLENRGLKVQVQGYGHVVYQSLLANAKVVKGATILLQLQP